MFENAPQIKVAEQQDFLVLKENWPAIKLFLQCQTQWNYISGMTGSVKTGLNYQAVETVMRLAYPDEDHATLFRKLQIIEQEALILLN